jgi:hypothetical protein
MIIKVLFTMMIKNLIKLVNNNKILKIIISIIKIKIKMMKFTHVKILKQNTLIESLNITNSL